MTTTAKVSVAIGRDELAWAKTLARREGKSLSAVVTESLAERRRLAALSEVVTWMQAGQQPLTTAELGAAQRDLSGGSEPKDGRRHPKRSSKAPRSKSPRTR